MRHIYGYTPSAFMAVLRIFSDVSVWPRCVIASRWKLCSAGEILFVFSENVCLVLYAWALLFCEKCFISFEFPCKASCALCGSVDFKCCFSVWNTFLSFWIGLCRRGGFTVVHQCVLSHRLKNIGVEVTYTDVAKLFYAFNQNMQLYVSNKYP